MKVTALTVFLMKERDKLRNRQLELFSQGADDVKMKDHYEYQKCSTVIQWITDTLQRL